MSEDQQPDAGPDLGQDLGKDIGPDLGQDFGQDLGQGVSPTGETRLSDIVVSHLSDQVRRTTQAAKARRVTSASGEPGMTDLTPLRELFADLVEELRKVRARERIAHALRDAADRIDPPLH